MTSGPRSETEPQLQHRLLFIARIVDRRIQAGKTVKRSCISGSLSFEWSHSDWRLWTMILIDSSDWWFWLTFLIASSNSRFWLIVLIDSSNSWFWLTVLIDCCDWLFGLKVQLPMDQKVSCLPLPEYQTARDLPQMSPWLRHRHERQGDRQPS